MGSTRDRRRGFTVGRIRRRTNSEAVKLANKTESKAVAPDWALFPRENPKGRFYRRIVGRGKKGGKALLQQVSNWSRLAMTAGPEKSRIKDKGISEGGNMSAKHHSM